MTKNEKENFPGFSQKTLEFLTDLSENNNKIWFEEHRYDYNEYLMKPLRNLVIDLGEFMLAAIDPYLDVNPAINRTISKIYRDIRFSNDKSPFKSTMWITFKRPNKDWKDEPTYFFEISPAFYRYGMGFYCASKDTMDKFREVMDKKPKEFMKSISFLSKQNTFVLEGGKYKRLIDKNKPEEIQQWYQRRNLYLVCNRPIEKRLFSRKLIDDLISGFEIIAPFYHFLWNIKGR